MPAKAEGAGWALKTSETLCAGRPAEKCNAMRSNKSPDIIFALHAWQYKKHDKIIPGRLPEQIPLPF